MDYKIYLWLVWVAPAWALDGCTFCTPKYVAGGSPWRHGLLWSSWRLRFPKYSTALPTYMKHNQDVRYVLWEWRCLNDTAPSHFVLVARWTALSIWQCRNFMTPWGRMSSVVTCMTRKEHDIWTGFLCEESLISITSYPQANYSVVYCTTATVKTFREDSQGDRAIPVGKLRPFFNSRQNENILD